VTTESGKWHGVDIWGLPKVVADITCDEGPETAGSLIVDGQTIVEMTVDHPPMFDQEDDGYAYSVKDGDLVRLRTDIEGTMGLWPYSTKVDLTFGDHPQADRLRTLDIRDRAIYRFGASDLQYTFYPARPIEDAGDAGG